MRISQAAGLVGVAPHVLRHWESEGVLVPNRVGDQREFSDQHVNEARIIHRLRRVGVGLPAIKKLRSARSVRRSVLLTAAAERMRAESIRLEAAAAFLRHAAECRHPIIDECSQCRDYATAESDEVTSSGGAADPREPEAVADEAARPGAPSVSG